MLVADDPNDPTYIGRSFEYLEKKSVETIDVTGEWELLNGDHRAPVLPKDKKQTAGKIFPAKKCKQRGRVAH